MKALKEDNQKSEGIIHGQAHYFVEIEGRIE